MAHALQGYDGLCAHLHGHSYCLTVTVIGKPLAQVGHPKDGMVMDFNDLKKIVQQEIIDHCDHALMLNKNQQTEIPCHNNDSVLLKKTVLVDYQPTSENLVIDFAQRIAKKLPQHVNLHHLILHETETSSAEWWAEDNEIKNLII